MSFKAAKIHETFLAPGNAVFPVDGSGAQALGNGGNGILEIEPFQPFNSKMGKEFPNLTNFKATLSSMQFGQAWLAALIGYVIANDVSAKIVTAGVAKATNYTSTGGIFTFENARSLGIDFEINLTPKEREIKIILERAFGISTGDDIIDDSTTDALAGALSIPTLTDAAVISDEITPDFDVVTIDGDRLGDYQINIKTNSKKNAYNKSLIKRFDVQINGVLDGADPAEMADILAHEYPSDITIAVPITSTYNLIFKSGNLSKNGKARVGDEDRDATVLIKGGYDPEFVNTTTNITFNSIYS